MSTTKKSNQKMLTTKKSNQKNVNYQKVKQTKCQLPKSQTKSVKPKELKMSTTKMSNLYCRAPPSRTLGCVNGYVRSIGGKSGQSEGAPIKMATKPPSKAKVRPT